jgi:hypothetical protein
MVARAQLMNRLVLNKGLEMSSPRLAEFELIRTRTSCHRDPGTTKLYDRRGYNPEKAASFFATSAPVEHI